MNWLCLAGIVITTHSNPVRLLTRNQEAQSSSFVTILFILFVGILGGLFYYDRRNGHVYTRALRGAISDLIVRYKNRNRELSEKIDMQEPPQTPKNIHVFDHEKTYLEAGPKTKKYNTEDTIKQQVQMPQQIKVDAPEPDFKGVFEIKESKSKHKANKKSKSKLKGRLLGKGSDDGDELDRSGEVQGSNLMDQNEVSKDNVEEEETKGIQVLQ